MTAHSDIEEARDKKKKKRETKEKLKTPPMTIYEAVEALDKRVCQLIEVEQKLLHKVGDIECRLDTNGFPAGQSVWAGFKFNEDGTTEKQDTDEFLETSRPKPRK